LYGLFEKMKILVGFEGRLCFLLLVKAPPGGVKLGRKSKKNPSFEFQAMGPLLAVPPATSVPQSYQLCVSAFFFIVF
jgi:hypothetical protein